MSYELFVITERKISYYPEVQHQQIAQILHQQTFLQMSERIIVSYLQVKIWDCSNSVSLILSRLQLRCPCCSLRAAPGGRGPRIWCSIEQVCRGARCCDRVKTSAPAPRFYIVIWGFLLTTTT